MTTIPKPAREQEREQWRPRAPGAGRFGVVWEDGRSNKRGRTKFWRSTAARGNGDNEDLRSLGTGNVCNDYKRDNNYSNQCNNLVEQKQDV